MQRGVKSQALEEFVTSKGSYQNEASENEHLACIVLFFPCYHFSEIGARYDSCGGDDAEPGLGRSKPRLPAKEAANAAATKPQGELASKTRQNIILPFVLISL